MKRVQFVSPPQSPESYGTEAQFPGRLDAGEGSRSPPAIGLSFTTNNAKDLLRGGSADETLTSFNQRFPENSATNTSFSLPSSGTNTNISFSGQKSPMNPFARTLTTSNSAVDAQEQDDTARFRTGSSAGRSAVPSNKSTMDVDAFTRMLLGGTSAATKIDSQNLASQAGPGSSAQSSSQQFGYEPTHQPGNESPRSLSDISPSDGEDDGDDADHTERSGLMSEARPKNHAPTPPQHRHGTPIAQKGPRTVSFADFDTSFTTSAPPQSPRISQITNEVRPSLSRSSSDLNKPLPPPPPPESESPEVGPPTPEKDFKSEVPRPSSPTAEKGINSKKAPPPPPPASRRKAPSRSDATGTRIRASSDLSQTSYAGDEGLEVRPTRPAPPPSRAAPDNAVGRIPIVQTPNESDSHAETSSEKVELESQPGKMKPPPPPPTRNSGKPMQSLSRTSSVQSNASGGVRRVSPGLGAVPPPPPPRRSDGKRASYDGSSRSPDARRTSTDSRASSKDFGSRDLRRVSGQSFGAERRDSLSSLQQVAEDSSTKPENEIQNTSSSPNDILADLSAFQRELDELRSKT